MAIRKGAKVSKKLTKAEKKKVDKVLEAIKEIKAPNYEPDIGRLHNLVRAELAVVKAEEEKKAESDKQENIKKEKEDKLNSMYFIDTSIKRGDPYDARAYEGLYLSQQIKRYGADYLDRELKQLNQKYEVYLIRSIISSLGLGATAMFLILNT